MSDNNNFAADTVKSGREGYVYLVHAKGTGRYKIGRSTNPLKRYETLKTQSPYPLTVIKSFYTFDMIADEAFLHAEFGKFRIYGEWFEITWDISTIIHRFNSITILNLTLARKSQIEELGIDTNHLLWKVAWFDCQFFSATNGSWYEYYVFVESLYQKISTIMTKNEFEVDLVSYAIGFLDSHTQKCL